VGEQRRSERGKKRKIETTRVGEVLYVVPS
jgi:hypothetical protein